jgi:hypothetical protein
MYDKIEGHAREEVVEVVVELVVDATVKTIAL